MIHFTGSPASMIHLTGSPVSKIHLTGSPASMIHLTGSPVSKIHLTGSPVRGLAGFTVALTLFFTASATAQSELVIYKEGSTVYHRAGCPVLKDMTGVTAMTRAQAESCPSTPGSRRGEDRKSTR